jgi:hypothetical protein
MGSIIFGRTQQAIETPFIPNRNPGFGGVPSDIEADNVQDAIEEAKLDALSNDRYIVLASYGGNANSGRSLEAFPGIDMSQAPIFIPAASKLVSVVLGATANSTGTVSFYNRVVSTTIPFYSISLISETRKIASSTPLIPLAIIPAGAEIEIRVSSGSVSKPYIYFFLSAAT